MKLIQNVIFVLICFDPEISIETICLWRWVEFFSLTQYFYNWANFTSFILIHLSIYELFYWSNYKNRKKCMNIKTKNKTLLYSWLLFIVWSLPTGKTDLIPFLLNLRNKIFLTLVYCIKCNREYTLDIVLNLRIPDTYYSSSFATSCHYWCNRSSLFPHSFPNLYKLIHLFSDNKINTKFIKT